MLREETVNTGNAKQCLADVGCSPSKAERIITFLEADQLPEVRQALKCLRCDLMEELHRAPRRVDRIDWLIRETEKPQAAATK